MKLLPDNPSLDHLRQQAKDLLAGLRESNQATTLAQAQRSLAQQYGFRTWPDLKAEVDRRRNSAEVADPALAVELAHTFDLGTPIEAMRSIADDDMGRMWSMTTDRGRWAVRTMDTWYPIVDAETDVELQLAASAAGVALPLPKRSRSGAIVEKVDDHPWRVCEWKHGGPPLVAPVDAATTWQVGRILATIHRLAAPADRISPWHASRLASHDWRDTAGLATASRRSWSTNLSNATPDLVDLEAVGALPAPADPVLTHNVLGPGNVRRDGAGELIVLCWEHAGGQPPGWELCDALAHWVVDPNGGVNTAAARSMVDGYVDVMGSAPRLEIAAFHGVAISLLNYLHGLIGDALAETDGERRLFTDRVIHHLLGHLPTRRTFDQILDVFA